MHVAILSLHVVEVIVLVPWIPHVKLVYQLVGVNVGVEASHDGKDDADNQQQAGKQQELNPLEQQMHNKYWLVHDL